jgi:HD-GYP domain-containing protein (c-di-GMP phosphodiesterase class II)
MRKIAWYNDFPDLEAPLRRYLGLVAVVGPISVAVMAIARPAHVTWNMWALAAILTALAFLAEQFPLHLTHKTNVNVGTTVYVAMLVLLPWPIIGPLVLVASIAAQIIRIRANPEYGIAEPLFNIGQTVLYVSCGALTVGALEHHAVISQEGAVDAIAVLAVASLTMHIVNTGLVAIAAGLQMRVSPIRVWWTNLALDLTPHVTMTVLGGMAAALAGESLLMLPLLALPGYLVHRAVSQTIHLRNDTQQALAALVEVIEMRDPYTAGHSRRVAASSRLIALKLGLTAEEADVIESAGQVHDIGKIALDPGILAKTTGLSPEEWASMRMHSVHGANVIDRFKAYSRASEAIRHHHESWDGSGYPDGLSGPAIPLAARILAVADAFDAMTSDRPYRSGISAAAAREVLEKGAGQQWDPSVVQAFLAVFDTSFNAIPLNRTATAPVPTLVAAA